MKRDNEPEFFDERKRTYRWVITILLFITAALATTLVILQTVGESSLSPDSYEEPPVIPHATSVTQTTQAETTAMPTTRPAPVYTLPPEEGLISEIALVADLNEDKIVFSKNSDLETSPASLTKIVTTSLVLQKYGDKLATTWVNVPEEAVKPFEGTIASVVPLRAGETVTLEDLVYATMLPSACDAANVLAYFCGNGDPQKFIDEMNAYVESIGCANTHFMNAHGLDAEGQHTTAEDMYIIAKAAMNIPGFTGIVSKSSFTMSRNSPDLPRTISTTVALISKESPYYLPNALGIKTGSTSKAGRCLITTAEKDGCRYLSITMKAPFNAWDTEKEKILAAQIDGFNLLKWAFACAGVNL